MNRRRAVGATIAAMLGALTGKIAGVTPAVRRWRVIYDGKSIWFDHKDDEWHASHQHPGEYIGETWYYEDAPRTIKEEAREGSLRRHTRTEEYADGTALRYTSWADPKDWSRDIRELLEVSD